MSDYDNEFEIEELVERDDIKDNQNKGTLIAGNSSKAKLNHNNMKEIPLSTRKVHQLNNQDNGQSFDFKKIPISDTPTQEFAKKPNLKTLTTNSSSDRKNFNLAASIDRKQNSEFADPKQYSKPFQLQKRSVDDLKQLSTAEDNQVKFSKPLMPKRQQYNFEENTLPITTANTLPVKGPQLTKKNVINNFVHSEKPSQYEKMKKLFISTNNNISTKSDGEVEEENKEIRKQLREMNQLLTKIIENRDITRTFPKKIIFDEKPVEDRLQTFDREIQNHQRTISLLLEEHRSLKNRIEQIKTHDYWMKLSDKITEIYQKIDLIRKENKQLDLQMHQLGKNIANVEIIVGAPDDLIVFNERARALVVMNKKNDKLKVEVGDFQKQKSKQLKTIDELHQKVMKLEALAEQYSVDIRKNPLKQKFNDLIQDIKAHEDGIKILKNRNEKFTEIYFDNQMDEVRLSIQRDKEHILKLNRMIHTQGIAVRDLIAKESPNVDQSVRELFVKFQVPLDNHKPSFAEENIPMNENELQAELDSKKSPMLKGIGDRDDPYKDLPIFTPKRNEIKSLKVKRDGKLTKSVGRKRPRSPEDQERTIEETYDLYIQKKDDSKKINGAPKQNQVKATIDDVDKELKNEKKEQTKMEEETKPSFSKPFGLKKNVIKIENNQMLVDLQKEPDKVSYEKADKTKDLPEKSKEIENRKDSWLDDENESQVEDNKHEKNLDFNHLSNNPSKLSYQGQPLILPDEITKVKTDQSIKLSALNFGKSTVSYDNDFSKGREKISGIQENTNLNQKQMDKDFLKEDYEVGSSRLNQNRTLKKENDSEELALNFGNDSKKQEKLTSDHAVENKVSKLGFILNAKKNSNSENKDMFGKYDNLPDIDSSKKKVSDVGDSKLNFDDNNRVKNPEKTETILDKNDDPKPFTLSSQQGGPKRVINADPYARQIQPLNTNNQQPLNTNQNQLSGFRSDENQRNSFWNKKVDDTEIKTIGESDDKDKPKELGNKSKIGNKSSNQDPKDELDDFYSGLTKDKKDKSTQPIREFNLGGDKNLMALDKIDKNNQNDGIKFDTNKNLPIRVEKDKQLEPIGGLKTENKKDPSIWDKKDKDIANQIKMDSGMESSIWRKKDQLTNIKDAEVDKAVISKENLGRQTKKNEGKLEELSSLNNNSNSDKRSPDLGVSEEKKKSKHLKLKETTPITEGVDYSENKDAEVVATQEKKKKKHVNKELSEAKQGEEVENLDVKDSEVGVTEEKKTKKKSKKKDNKVSEETEKIDNDLSEQVQSEEKKKKKRSKPKESDPIANDDSQVLKFDGNESKTNNVTTEKTSKDNIGSGLKKKVDKVGDLGTLNENKGLKDQMDDGKRPKQLKMNQNETKKKVLADGTQGNDFFDDLEI